MLNNSLTLLIFRNLVASKQLSTIIVDMCNFVTKFGKILETYMRFRKRIETVFSQFKDYFMMIRNYSKIPAGFFARMADKVAVFTMLQYFTILNHRPIRQVKYALFKFNQQVL